MESSFDKYVGHIDMMEAVDHVTAISVIDHRLVEKQLDATAAMLDDDDEFDLPACLAAARRANTNFARVTEEFRHFVVGTERSTRSIDGKFALLFEQANCLAYRHLYDASNEELKEGTEQHCQIASQLFPILIGCFRFSSEEYVVHEAMYAKLAQLLLFARSMRDQHSPHFNLPENAEEREHIEQRVWNLVDGMTKLLTLVLYGHPLMLNEYARQEEQKRIKAI